MVNTNRLMFANDYQRLQLFFAWLLSPYYPNSQLFTRFQFRKLLTINEKRKPSSDFLFDLKAEDEGFKPPIPERGIPDFEPSAFGHSANLPIASTKVIKRW